MPVPSVSTILDFLAFENLAGGERFGVQNLATQGKNRLRAAVAAHPGGATGRLTFDDEEFRFLRIGRAAIEQFAGEAQAA
jgi:hypothetical protein